MAAHGVREVELDHEEGAVMTLTKQQRQAGVAESFATLRLEGMHPSPAAKRDAEDYIEGRRTLDELIADVVARHTRD